MILVSDGPQFREIFGQRGTMDGFAGQNTCVAGGITIIISQVGSANRRTLCRPHTGGSSNGRTAAFGVADLGSNPSPPANTLRRPIDPGKSPRGFSLFPPPDNPSPHPAKSLRGPIPGTRSPPAKNGTTPGRRAEEVIQGRGDLRERPGQGFDKFLIGSLHNHASIRHNDRKNRGIAIQGVFSGQVYGHPQLAGPARIEDIFDPRQQARQDAGGPLGPPE